MEDLNDNTKNLYIIKRRLAELKRRSPESHFSYYVGSFLIKINIPGVSYRDPGGSLVSYDPLHVSLFEEQRDKNGDKNYEFVHLEHDARFANYQPIKYADYPGYSNGRSMPLLTLCELCKYLHRLSNLAIFM